MADTVSELPFWPLFGMGVAFLGFGTIAAMGAGKTLLQIQNARRWPLVPATITEVEISEHRVRSGRSRSRLARSARATFRFTDKTGATRHVRYQTAQSTRLSIADFEVGKTVDLRVNPNNPTEFRRSLWPDVGEWIFLTATFAFGGFGLGLLVLAFL